VNAKRDLTVAPCRITVFSIVLPSENAIARLVSEADLMFGGSVNMALYSTVRCGPDDDSLFTLNNSAEVAAIPNPPPG
jgi:hypothetical protein